MSNLINCNNLCLLFWIVGLFALVFSVLYGVRAYFTDIVQGSVERKAEAKEKIKAEEKTEAKEKINKKAKKECYEIMHQVWFNFVGSAFGWAALYYVLRTGLWDFELKHFVALLIAFVGITGHLPET